MHFRNSAGGVFIRIQRATVPETLPRILSECETSERNTPGSETEWTVAEKVQGRTCKLYFAATWAIIFLGGGGNLCC